MDTKCQIAEFTTITLLKKLDHNRKPTPELHITNLT